MGKSAELDLELHNLAKDFRNVAKTYNLNVFQLYEMLPSYLMKCDTNET